MRVAATPTSFQTPGPTKRYASDFAPASATTDAKLLQRIDHAGYKRYILQRNPPRFDPDGDIVEPDDEYDDEDDLEAVQENPYSDIHIESTRNF
jgi:hypothetical protein